MADRDDLWEAIIEVETGGLADRELVVGDGGRSVGIAQIRKGVVDDVNNALRRAGSEKRYGYDDRKNRANSKELFNFYLDRWGKVYKKLNGRSAGNKELARIWNGGPTGWRKEATLGYWGRVKKVLENLEGRKDGDD